MGRWSPIPGTNVPIGPAHLAPGPPLAAIVDGRCVDTTMGFTPLDGLITATRSGSLDPGWCSGSPSTKIMNPHEIADALEHRSGLLALAGTADMREVQARTDSGGTDARLALATYVHRLVTVVGAMTAAAGGLDALAFTGGVGENAVTVRSMATDRLAHLGLVVDPAADAAAPGTDISAVAAAARTLVIAAREDVMIARETRRVPP